MTVNTKTRTNALTLLWTLVPATLIAVTANVLFYYFVTRILGFELLVPSETTISVPLPVFDVVLFSIIWAVAAGIIFMVFVAITQNPIRIYIILSTVVLIASFGLPLMMPSDIVNFETKGTLMSMHVIGAGCVVSILVWLYQRQASSYA